MNPDIETPLVKKMNKTGFFVWLQMSSSVSMKKTTRKYLPMMTSRVENIKAFNIYIFVEKSSKFEVKRSTKKFYFLSFTKNK